MISSTILYSTEEILDDQNGLKKLPFFQKVIYFTSYCWSSKMTVELMSTTSETGPKQKPNSFTLDSSLSMTFVIMTQMAPFNSMKCFSSVCNAMLLRFTFI